MLADLPLKGCTGKHLATPSHDPWVRMKLEGIIAQLVSGPAQFGLSDIKYLSPLDFPSLQRSLPLCVSLCVLCVPSVHRDTGRPEDDLRCHSA